MGIIGRADPVQSTAIVTRDNFTGDGSTTQFVMTKKAPHERSVFITIDGIKQHEDVYSVADKTITFTSAPANNAKIETILIEDVVETAPADGSVTPNKTAGMQNIIQVVNNTDGSTITNCNTVIPWDNTIPQNTEGVEVITQAITPTDASNILLIEWKINAVGNAGNVIISALFQDSTADAIAVTAQSAGTTGHHKIINGSHYMVAGTTSSTTFKLRIGPHSAMSIYTNADSAGTGRFGGMCNSFLRITEIKA